MKKDTHSYDVAIIGAGLSGLVSACYLAKHGVKVVLVEKNYQVGGYCGSFKRNGFTFDSAAHSLGSCRENGQFGRIFKEFELTDKIKCKKSNPSDVVICDNKDYFIRGDVKTIIKDFQQYFPDEREAIKQFFCLADDFDINSTVSCMLYYRRFASKNFKSLLDSYFKNNRLKNILSTFLGNNGLPSEYVSCLAALGVFKEFVMDGGYFVRGGMQTLVDSLADNFKRHNGSLFLSNSVDKILVKNRKVAGVVLANNEILSCKVVISAADARTTFLKLLDSEHVPIKMKKLLLSMTPSVSAVIAYLGIKGRIANPHKARTLWYISKGNINSYYKSVFNGRLNLNTQFLVATFPSYFDESLAPRGCGTVQLYTVAPFISSEYWLKNEQIVVNSLKERLLNIIKINKRDIALEESASPATLLRYTNNYNGANYGWASTVKQSTGTLIRSKTFLEGLYQTGHWATYGAGQGGTPMAAYAGRITAQMVLKQLNKNII